MCRPLLRVTDKLLAIGLLTDKDLNQLLCLIDPTNFDNGYFSGIRSLHTVVLICFPYAVNVFVVVRKIIMRHIIKTCMMLLRL